MLYKYEYCEHSSTSGKVATYPLCKQESFGKQAMQTWVTHTMEVLTNDCKNGLK